MMSLLDYMFVSDVCWVFINACWDFFNF